MLDLTWRFLVGLAITVCLTIVFWFPLVLGTSTADADLQQATHTALSRGEQIALMQECVTDGRAVASDWRLYKDAAGTVNAVLAAAFFEYRTR